MKELIGNDWDQVLNPVFESSEYEKLHSFFKKRICNQKDFS